MRRKLLSIISIFLLLSVLVSCNASSSTPEKITIKEYERLEMLVGDTLQLEVLEKGFDIEWSSSSASATVNENGLVKAVSLGKSAIKAECQGVFDTVMIEVVEEITKAPETKPSTNQEGNGQVNNQGNNQSNNQSNNQGGSSSGTTNAQYASSVAEAKERAKKGIPAGSLTVPNQAPTISEYRPTKNGKYIRNTASNFIDEDTCVVRDAYGNEVFRIYRGGGYITLEEVAAYVYAFGTVPANYIEGKNMEPENSIWGEYLRLNHTRFSGDITKYPFEPVLPNISGCGGTLYYYEIDIGTTGTDCDPAYMAKTYNDGQSITRGAARIVYGKYDLDRDGIYEFGEHHVFYTYNHYNDFQEYLNYYGGWGEMFGNITGGGKLSSKTNYNPTSYIYVVWEELPTKARTTVYYFYIPKQYEAYAA